MIYRIRIILDVKEDVLRDIEIEENATLEDFHHAITQAFGFLGNEIASFYSTNDVWEQGDEMPLEAMEIEKPSFSDTPLNSVFSSEVHKLLYIYDFLSLWTFFIEIMEVGEKVCKRAIVFCIVLELSMIISFCQGQTLCSAPIIRPIKTAIICFG